MYNYRCSIRSNQLCLREQKCNSFQFRSSVSVENPRLTLILTTHLLLTPSRMTSFIWSSNNFLYSSSSFVRFWLRITCLNCSLPFNLLHLSRMTFLVGKLSNFINNGLAFEDSTFFVNSWTFPRCLFPFSIHWFLL